MLGEWKVDVKVGQMPQGVATAMAKMNERVGAVYEPVAYLGSQLANGTNHAVLAIQTLVTGRDVKNAVIVFFRETKEGVVDYAIERVVEGGDGFGGTEVEAVTEIPEDVRAAVDKAFKPLFGVAVEPVVLLATQPVAGVNYVLLATVKPVYAGVDAPTDAILVTVNGLMGGQAYTTLLRSRHDVSMCGAAAALK